MPHKGNYNGKKPTPKMKEEAMKMHSAKDEKEMKKKRKKMMTSDGYMKA